MTAKQHQQFGAVMLPSSVSVSPSSPRSSADSYATDDSMEHHHHHQQHKSSHLIAAKASSKHRSASNTPPQQHASRSPILVKYNYYDYNGERQENHELLLLAANNNNNNNSGQQQKLHQRQQLSPTFRENLDQILVRSTSSASQQPSGGQESLSSSPVQQHSTMTLLARRYNRSSYEHRCLRCKHTVYQMDKVGPLKEFSFLHQNCFKCFECGTKLTLKTYFNNQHSSTDLEVYCHRHCPKTPAGRLDNQSVGIRAALNAPKVFEPMPMNLSMSMSMSMNLNGGQLGAVSPAAISGFPETSDSQQQQQQPHKFLGSGALDSRALHIQHAMRQTKLQAIYKQSQVDKKISQFLERRLEYLEPKQKLLEMRHREEEEQLFRAFELKWRQEEQHIRDQIRDEWQCELDKLLEKYKLQLSSLSNSNQLQATNNNKQLELQQKQINLLKHQQSKQQLAANLAAAAAAAARAAKEQTETPSNADNNSIPKSKEERRMIELERMNLEKTMTIKLDRKKQTLKRKLKEFERQATAELVEKQSREMLALISMKLKEFKEEQKRKIGSDLEQFEALEALANQLGNSLQIEHSEQQPTTVPGSKQSKLSASPRPSGELMMGADKLAQACSKQPRGSAPAAANHLRPQSSSVASQSALSAGQAPAPSPPKVSKWQLYECEQADEVFREIDARAINIAQEDQQSFTDLVHHLTRNCLSDIEKVRAIFRWITVKNLNTMQFDSSIKPDTPFGLLRGIKQGSESYHVLFKRLCSYAGLHCVVIKGYSKSAGYQPGVQFEGNRFRNSWNAVYVAGAWRFVQCNWGARHLVSVAVMQDKNSSTTSSDTPSGGGGSSKNLGRRGNPAASNPQAAGKHSEPRRHHHQHHNNNHHHHHHHHQLSSADGGGLCSPSNYSTNSTNSSSGSTSTRNSTKERSHHQQVPPPSGGVISAEQQQQQADSLRYEYDDHYFLTDPDEFIYEFFPLASEWQLLTKSERPIALSEFEQLPFVRSLFFKYGLYFPQPDIRSVLFTDSSGATTIKIGMPTHMVPNLIFHYNLKYFNSDQEQYDGISLKRFVMQSVESCVGSGSHYLANNTTNNSNTNTPTLSNVVSFRVHVPENGSYILDIFANSTTPTQYITGEPMKFKSVCKFKIIAKNLRTVMIPLPDCASGEYGPMKATRLFGIIPLTHESGLISLVDSSSTQTNSTNNNNNNSQRLLEIQFRITRPLLDFMASLHKNNSDERILSKWIKIFIDGDIVFIQIKFQEDGQYGLDIYTRDQHQLAPSSSTSSPSSATSPSNSEDEPKRQLLTHCCKYLINVRTATSTPTLTR